MKRTVDFRDRDRELEIRMTPMIDVVFLLLVFFVWTASFKMVDEVLPTSLGIAIGSSETTEIPDDIDYDKVIIRLNSDAKLPLTLNAAPIKNQPELKAYLEAIFKAKQDVDVIIHPDQNVVMERVIDIFDLVQTVGFRNIQFATPIGAR